MTTAPPPMTDRNIIEVRKAQVGRYGTVDPTKPYADSIAFARAIISARDAHWQATIAANPVERRVPSVVDLCAGPLHGFDDHCDPVADPLAQPQAEAVPQSWRTVLPGGKHTDKWESSRVDDYNQGWNDYRKAANANLEKLEAAPQQAEAVPPDVVRDAERYRWLRSKSHYEYTRAWIGGHSTKKNSDVDFLSLDEALGAIDASIDAAIAQQKG